MIPFVPLRVWPLCAVLAPVMLLAVSAPAASAQSLEDAADSAAVTNPGDEPSEATTPSPDESLPVEEQSAEEPVEPASAPDETMWADSNEGWGEPAQEEESFSLRWGGGVQSDIRFRTEEKSLGSFPDQRILPTGVERSENRLKLKLTAPGDRFTGVADLDFVWTGRVREMESFSELTLQERTAPFRLEAHALFIEARDILVDGLDLRIGQQKVMWGVGDQFNPLNNLNAEDLEDPLLFGDQQANLMARLDYSPFIGSESWILDQLT
ncbi:MAG: hypothetical protein VX938_05210, partial [Myxococcota bacterium]|nr:hypothetical protein [Myxococcota bacterium]